MDLNWYESILYGLLSGLTEILPVSAQAHRLLLLKLFGVGTDPNLMRLLIHLSTLGALYYCCQSQITRITRARSLAKVPKRRRKRPLDTRSLMDFSLFKTMLLPIILGLLLYNQASRLESSLTWIAVFMFVNGLILYIPQFLPSSNKDSRTLSRVEGLLMGLGGAVSVLPGISAIGAATSVGRICGVERSYGLNMALLMDIALMAGLCVYDVIGIVSNGAVLSFGIVVDYILAAAAAFGGTVLGVKIMRGLAANIGFSWFAYYCWGASLFTFILNLMA